MIPRGSDRTPWESQAREAGYTVLGELSSGGMATLYLALQFREPDFERLVVLKRLHPHLSSDQDSCRLFHEEARLSGLVVHPNVVSVEDVLRIAGETFLVSRYFPSVTLAQLAKAAKQLGRRLEPRVAIRILADVLVGLHAVHEARGLDGAPLGVVHRDWSPRNLLVGSDGYGRLIDFGVSKSVSTLTSGTTVRGTLAYLSPEQVDGKPLDRRSDLFAAGAVIYEALVGERLFRGADESETLARILAVSPPTLPSDLECPAAQRVALDAVMCRALARVPDERYRSALELSEALCGAVEPASHHQVALANESLCGPQLELEAKELEAAVELCRGERHSRVEPAPASPASTSVEAELALGEATPTPARHALRPVAIGGGLLALGLLAGWLGATRNPAPSAPSEVPPRASSSVASTVATPGESEIPETAPSERVKPAPVSSESTAAAPSNAPGPSEPRVAPKPDKPSPLKRNPYDP